MPAGDAIRDLLHGAEVLDPEAGMIDQRELLRITDIGSQYPQYVAFSTLQLKEKCIDWSSNATECEIPVAVVSGVPGSPFTASTVLAWKMPGSLGLVDHITVDCADCSPVAPPITTGYLCEPFRQAIEQTVQWQVSQAAEEGFALDTSASIVPSFQPGATGAAIYTDAGGNPLVNGGLTKRIAYFNQTFTFSAATASFQGVVRIRLANLHRFFAGLGCRYGFTMTSFKIWLAGIAGSIYSPFVVVAPGTNAGASGANPVVSVVGASGQALLRLDTLKPSHSMFEKLMSRAKSSKGERYEYTKCELPQTLINQTSPNVNLLLGNSFVKPQRLYLHRYPTGALGSSGLYPFVQLPAYQMNNIQVLVDSRPYFSYPIAQNNSLGQPNVIEVYRQLQDIMPRTQLPGETGGLIDYNAYLTAQNWHVINLSRRNGAENDNAPKQIQITAQIPYWAYAGAYDLIPVVETLEAVEFKWQNDYLTVRQVPV